MTLAHQRRLAILGAVLLAGLFGAANARLITLAVQSQSRCIAPAPDLPPARPIC